MNDGDDEVEPNRDDELGERALAKPCVQPRTPTAQEMECFLAIQEKCC